MHAKRAVNHRVDEVARAGGNLEQRQRLTSWHVAEGAGYSGLKCVSGGAEPEKVPDGLSSDSLAGVEAAATLERHELTFGVPAQAVQSVELISVQLRGGDVGYEIAVPFKWSELLVTLENSRGAQAAEVRVEHLDYPEDESLAPFCFVRDDAVVGALAAEPRIVFETYPLSSEVHGLSVPAVRERSAGLHGRLDG